jgi:hypothetical protein
MKYSMTALVAILAVSFAGTAFASNAKKHENKTPINNVAAEGVKDTNAAAAEGDLSGDQAHALNKKHKGVEHAEQKNADLRHGLVSKGDHKKYNAKAKKVNAERANTIQDNADEANKEEAKH